MTDNLRILKIYTAIIKQCKTFFSRLGYSEILPALQSPGFEFSVEKSYIVGNSKHPDIYLPASHSFQKQIACQYLNKVYTIAPCYRNENLSSLNSKMFYQIEAESIETNIFNTQKLIWDFLSALEIELHNNSLLTKTPKLIFESSDFINLPDRFTTLNINDYDVWSRELSLSIEKPTWLNYTPQTPKPRLNKSYKDNFSMGFDLILPMGYGEILSGGLRDKGELKKFYNNMEYINTSIDSCGFGIGLDRMVKLFLRAKSISKVQLPYNLV